LAGDNEQDAITYALQIGEALQEAHSHGIVHRDVKPANVWVLEDGSAKLLDFGVARAMARTSEKASTRIGTIEYMAPELFQGAAGTNADLWALGITLYELLTGHTPFDAKRCWPPVWATGSYCQRPISTARSPGWPKMETPRLLLFFLSTVWLCHP
jgi:serine/threonine-protein kinase